MIKKYLRFIKIIFWVLINNPRFFIKRIFLELKAFVLPLPGSSISKKINGVSFRFDFSYSPNIKKMYCNIYEMGVVETLKTFLKNGDTFIDVGANIGYITAIGASLVGKKGRVYSFEPVPEYFSKLRNLAETNSKYNIIANQFALSDRAGQEKIYVPGYPYIGGNTILSDLIGKEKIKDTISIQTYRLDEYIERENIENIKMIKIDVEGFEFPVLLGLERYLLKCQDTGSYPLIICEIIPSVYPYLGYKLENIFDYMERFSYYPFEIINIKKRIKINKIRKKGVVNILFKFCK